MAQGRIKVLKDWGVDPQTQKPKWSVQLDDGSDRWYNTRNPAFAQTHSVGNMATLEANEFPEPGSGKWWFHRFGAAGPETQAPTQTQTSPTRTDKDKSIFTQALAKATLDPQMNNKDIENRCQFLYGLFDRLGKEVENAELKRDAPVPATAPTDDYPY